MLDTTEIVSVQLEYRVTFRKTEWISTENLEAGLESAQMNIPDLNFNESENGGWEFSRDEVVVTAFRDE